MAKTIAVGRQFDSISKTQSLRPCVHNFSFCAGSKKFEICQTQVSAGSGKALPVWWYFVAAHLPQVFSKQRAVSIESRNRPSDTGLMASPAFEQSLKVQKVGMMNSFAPFAIISLNASGNAKSQQINIPTLPSGVSNTGWSSMELLVRCSRSTCPQRFFFT